MRRALLATVLISSLLLLVACGQKASETSAPLTHVPADTPFLFANTEPLDDATLDTVLSQANAQLPMQQKQLNRAADELRENQPGALAELVGVIAKELEGKSSYQQVAQDIGIDLQGLSAFYGIGLTPVLRMPVSDTERYQAFLQKLASAADQSLKDATLDDLDYRRAALGDSHLQLLSAMQDDQAVLALAPADASPTLLKQVLGSQPPEKSEQDSGQLEALTHAKNYLPYGLGYIDTTRLVTLLTDSEDPMVRTFHALAGDAQGKTPEPLPQECRDDAARLAARAPQLSLGYTALDADHTAQRLDVALAPDITKAFASLVSPLPGLGSDEPKAPFDLALAVPAKSLRDFLVQQAQNVANDPFDCAALAKLNTRIAALGQQSSKLAIPPFGSLRGIRLTLDGFDMPPGGQPQVNGALLVASKDPDGLLAIGQTLLPGLATLQLGQDGKPTALPAPMTAMIGAKQGWVAKSDKALGVAIGDGEQSKLRTLMQGSDGEAGELMHLSMDTTKLIEWLDTAVESPMGAMASGEQQTQEALTTLKAQLKNIDSILLNMRMTDDGLVFTSDTHWK